MKKLKLSKEVTKKQKKVRNNKETSPKVKKIKNKSKEIKIKPKKAGTIKDKLILSYVLCVVIPLVLVNLFSSSQSKSTVKETSSQLALEMVKQTSANISYYTDGVETSMTRIIINDLNASSTNLINEYITAIKNEDSDIGKLNKFNVSKQIRELLNYSVSLDESIEGYAIVIDEENQISSTIGMKTTTNLVSFLEEEVGNGTLWRLVNTDEGKEIYAIRKLANLRRGKAAGILIAKVDLEVLQEKVNSIKLFDNSKVSIVDMNGEIVCSNSDIPMSDAVKSNINFEESEKPITVGNSLVTYAKSNNGWQIVAEIPESALTTGISQVVRVVWLVIAIAALVAVFAGVFISRGITTSLKQLKDLMKKAETGDLTVEANIKGNNEFTEVGHSFNHMIENIKALLQEAKNTINHTLEAGDILKKSTSNSTETFSQLALSIENISEGSNSQAEDTQNSAIVMEKLSESIGQVIEDTSTLFKHNQGTRQIIEEANKNMQLLDGTMASTHTISNEISMSIKELSALTKAIGEVMSLLDGISEQTNLLALNASIEAARAGDIGKGFAVVANEVRNLATQSKESSSHVKENLRDIEKKVLHTANLVSKSNEVFSKQEVAVSKTNDSLKQMISGLHEMGEELENVNNRVSEMTMYKDEMGIRIESITTVTEENAAAVEEVNALSEEQKAVMQQLAHLASELMTSIETLDASVETFIIN